MFATPSRLRGLSLRKLQGDFYPIDIRSKIASADVKLALRR